MHSILDVPVRDAQHPHSPRVRHLASQDWDEIRAWSDKIYMPYRVSPTGPSRVPCCQLDSADLGHFTFSWFTYGIPIRSREFSPEPGKGMVLTTLNSSARHWVDGTTFIETTPGQAFVVDNSRTAYDVEFGDRQFNLNLTFDHAWLASFHEAWFGCPASDTLWLTKFRFGGPQSSWIALLTYLVRAISDRPELTADANVIRRLEELLGMHILTEWRQRLGDLGPGLTPRTYPRAVRAAEQFMEANLRRGATLTETARAASVSVRTLTEVFRTHRGETPMAFMRERRLLAIRNELLNCDPLMTVTEILTSWGVINLGVFSATYRRRFGELPSQSIGSAGTSRAAR